MLISQFSSKDVETVLSLVSWLMLAEANAELKEALTSDWKLCVSGKI